MLRPPSARIAAAFLAGVAATVTARRVFEGRPDPVFEVAARRALGPRFGPDRTRALLASAARRYRWLAPTPREAHTRMGRFYLRMSAYLLALRNALVEQGTPEREAEAILQSGLFRVMRVAWTLPDAVMRARHPRDPIARIRERQRLSHRFAFADPDFAMSEVAADGGYGVDVERCVMAEYFAAREASAFGERVMCAQDLLMARERGERLERAGTLAGGVERCAFRFGVG